jgi:LPS sulfotransferase NodH
MAERTWWDLVESPPRSTEYKPDFVAVADLVNRIREHDRHWDRLLASAGGEVVELSYEALVVDVPHAAFVCLKALGAPTDAALTAVLRVQSRIRKQSDDEVSWLWADEFERQWGMAGRHDSEVV